MSTPAMPSELKPHHYHPSTMHMGDCSICGNLAGSSIHVMPSAPASDELAFADLRQANETRQREWDKEGGISLSYRGNELAGETGEACNIIKKLERERLGIRGSRATVADLADELSDIIICADLIAMHEGVDLGAAVVTKFNATSEKYSLSTRLSRAEAPAADAMIATDIPDSGVNDRPSPFSGSLDGVSSSPAGREAEASPVIPSDVVELVCAARVVAFESQSSEALSRLDKASEAFADRVPWDDEPSIDRAAPAAGVALEALIERLNANAADADDNAGSGCNVEYVEPMKAWDSFATMFREAASALVSSAAEIAELQAKLFHAEQKTQRALNQADIEAERAGDALNDKEAAEAQLEAAAAENAELRQHVDDLTLERDTARAERRQAISTIDAAAAKERSLRNLLRTVKELFADDEVLGSEIWNQIDATLTAGER